MVRRSDDKPNNALKIFSDSQINLYSIIGNGEIDFSEFVEMMSKRAHNHPDPEADLREAFKVSVFK
jgi:Ca2+-binding EF-hand superfamily protein